MSTLIVKPQPFRPLTGSALTRVTEWCTSRGLATYDLPLSCKIFALADNSPLAPINLATGSTCPDNSAKIAAVDVYSHERWLPELRIKIPRITWTRGHIQLTVDLVDDTDLNIFSARFKRYELPAALPPAETKIPRVKRLGHLRYAAATWNINSDWPNLKPTRVRILANAPGTGPLAIKIKDWSPRSLDHGITALVEQSLVDVEALSQQIMEAVHADALAVELESTTPEI